MSKLFVDEIVHQSSQGSGTITLGASGETVALASGAEVSGFTGQNYPAFYAKLNSDQTATDDTTTKLALTGEIFDTNGCYNNTGSTVTLNGISVPSYSFAPNVAGKYYIFVQVIVNASSTDNVQRALCKILKNDTSIAIADFIVNSSSEADILTPSVEAIVELNGTSDYVNAQGYADIISGTLAFKGDATEARTFLGAYRIGA